MQSERTQAVALAADPRLVSHPRPVHYPPVLSGASWATALLIGASENLAWAPGRALANMVTGAHGRARAREDTCPRHAESEKIANGGGRAWRRARPRRERERGATPRERLFRHTNARKEEDRKVNRDGWTGMPPKSEEDVESEAVHYIHRMVKWMRELDHDAATWRVGTTGSLEKHRRMMSDTQVPYEMCGWCSGSAKRAAEELAEYHGMELEGIPDEHHECIVGYTDREPTREERRRRNKEPLTLKQKAVFRAIRSRIAEHGSGPKKSEVMRAMGHRSSKTTNGYLAILARKNWIHPPGGGLSIELN